MYAKTFAAACGLALLAGCAGQAAQPVNADHPAHPDAPAAPPLPPSTTLAVATTRPAAPSTRPTEGAALYACPHHPEVTSDKPDQRCPKCNMKLVEKHTAGPAATGHEGHK